jgi:hypothetical protein
MTLAQLAALTDVERRVMGSESDAQETPGTLADAFALGGALGARP